MYVFNVTLGQTIFLCFACICVIVLEILNQIESKQLKRLVRLIDIMSYVTEDIERYAIEIVEIVNKLTIKTINSAEGKIANRYTKLIRKFDVFSLGNFLHDHSYVIQSKKKRIHLVNIIKHEVQKFYPEKLGRMLSELIIFKSKDYENSFKTSQGNEAIKNLILKFANDMIEKEYFLFINEFDVCIHNELEALKPDVANDNDREVAKEKSATLLRAEYIKIKTHLGARIV